MYKELLSKNNNDFCLDHTPIEINEEVKPYYLDLVVAKLENSNHGYKRIKKELIERNKHDYFEKIYVSKKKYEEIKKEIYLFTEIACTTDLINDVNVIDFNNAELALDYSMNLCRRYKEYHLIKRNKYAGYSVYHTLEEYNQDELEKTYQKKYVK